MFHLLPTTGVPAGPVNSSANVVAAACAAGACGAGAADACVLSAVPTSTEPSAMAAQIAAVARFHRGDRRMDIFVSPLVQGLRERSHAGCARPGSVVCGTAKSTAEAVSSMQGPDQGGNTPADCST